MTTLALTLTTARRQSRGYRAVMDGMIVALGLVTASAGFFADRMVWAFAGV